MAKQYMLVHLNDARVIGPFDSEDQANAWARKTPNKLFEDHESWDHAETNCDFWVAELESP